MSTEGHQYAIVFISLLVFWHLITNDIHLFHNMTDTLRTLRQLFLPGTTCLDICQHGGHPCDAKAWEGGKNWRGFVKAGIIVTEGLLEKVI